MAVILISSYLGHNRKIVSFNKYILSENGRWGSKETKQTKIWIRLKGNTNKKRFYFRNLLSFARVGWTWDLICSSTESVKIVSSCTETRTSTQLVGGTSQGHNEAFSNTDNSGVTVTAPHTSNIACEYFSLIIRQGLDFPGLSWSFRKITKYLNNSTNWEQRRREIRE